MKVKITITSVAADATIFDLYSDTDGYTTPFETGLSAASLIVGYTSTLVPDNTTSIRLKNVGGSCVNYVDIILKKSPINPDCDLVTGAAVQQ